MCLGRIESGLFSILSVMVLFLTTACGDDATSVDPTDSSLPLVVGPGERIQDAIAAAYPGDTVTVLPGTYVEAVLILKENITVVGVVEGDSRPILDGQGVFENGFEVRPPEAGEDGWVSVEEGGDPHETTVGDAPPLTGFTISGFEIHNYTENAVFTSLVNDVVMRDIISSNTGVYGLFPVAADGILIEDCQTTGAWDTGIYVGQSHNIVVRNNEVFGNTCGIEIENSTNAVVENNWAHDNAGGILAFILPNLDVKEATNVLIQNNIIEYNNGENLAPEGTIISNVPSGSGIIVLAADEVEITGNTFRENGSMAITVVAHSIFSMLGATIDDDEEIDTSPHDTWIHDNIYESNGQSPSEVIDILGAQSDIIYDGTGSRNCIDEDVELSYGLQVMQTCEEMEAAAEEE